MTCVHKSAEIQRYNKDTNQPSCLEKLDLTCGMLLPSAPQRHDQWGPRCTAAAPWVQSVRREDGLGKTTRGDGPAVDGRSPSG